MNTTQVDDLAERADYNSLLKDIAAADDYFVLADIRRRRIPQVGRTLVGQYRALQVAVVERENELGRLAGISGLNLG